MKQAGQTETEDPGAGLTPEIQDLVERLKPRANSLIVTVFGDAIMPRGGAIWLGLRIWRRRQSAD